MTIYLPIARKFRPTRFADVVGQAAVVQTLKNAILQGKTSHAYLFCGLRGTGKTSLARIFAKALNCESPINQVEPCNACSSCKEITGGYSLDVIEIDGASNRGIDDIRKLSENIGIATFQGRYRIYIIDEVHMLTKEAFNALLKTLEEPPQNVKFFLATTEPHKILPTILSRCQRFDLKRIDESLIVQKLHEIVKDLQMDVEEDVLLLIAALSEGSLRDAETLLDRILITETSPIGMDAATRIFALLPVQLFGKLDETFASGEIGAIFSIADEIFGSGFNTNYLLDSLIQHYRHIFYAYHSSIASLKATKQEKEITAKALTIYSMDQIYFILDFLISLQSRKQNLEFSRTEIEMILLHIVQTKQRVSLDQVLAELQGRPITTPKAPAPLEAVKVEEKHILKAPVVIQPIEEMVPIAPAPPLSPVVAPTPVEAIPFTTPPPSKPLLISSPLEEDIRQETLLRFASVELGGMLKKH